MDTHILSKKIAHSITRNLEEEYIIALDENLIPNKAIDCAELFHLINNEIIISVLKLKYFKLFSDFQPSESKLLKKYPSVVDSPKEFA